MKVLAKLTAVSGLIVLSTGCSLDLFGSKESALVCIENNIALPAGYAVEPTTICDAPSGVFTWSVEEATFSSVANSSQLTTENDEALAGFTNINLRHDFAYTLINSPATSPIQSEIDGVNRVFFRDQSPGVGIAYLGRTQCNMNTALQYMECDHRIYGRQQVSSAVSEVVVPYVLSSPNAANDEIEVSSILQHEYVHGLGLQDNTVSGSIMYVDELKGRTPGLSSDDVQALQHIYMQ